MAPDLIAEIGLNATQLGLLSAVYFFTFAAFQIPLGVLLDRFGPRRAQGTLYFVAGMGVFLFSVGESMITLMLKCPCFRHGICLPVRHWYRHRALACRRGWSLSRARLLRCVSRCRRYAGCSIDLEIATHSENYRQETG